MAPVRKAYVFFSVSTVSASSSSSASAQQSTLNHSGSSVQQLVRHPEVVGVESRWREGAQFFLPVKLVTVMSLACRRGNERPSSIIHLGNKLINEVNEEEQRQREKKKSCRKRHSDARLHPGAHINPGGKQRGPDVGSESHP